MYRFASAGLFILGTATTPLSLPRDRAEFGQVDRQAAVHTVVISGRVTDAFSGRALGSAVVRVFNTTVGTSTNDSGVFSFSWQRPSASVAEVELQVQRLGYAPERRTVRVTGNSVVANFALNLPTPGTATVVTLSEPRATIAAGGAARGGGGGGGRGGGGAAQSEMARARPASAQIPPPCAMGATCANTEAYDKINESPFLATATNALSTFSIDVDRASYSNVRRFIRSGQRPPKDAVRIEEMINYFSWDYPAPTGAVPFSVNTEVAVAPWNSQHRLVRIGLQGQKIETASLPPNNLVFLIDVSGSMMPSNKLPLVKSSLRLLVEQLREQDRVAMVVYAGSAGLVLEPTSGADKARLLEAIDRLEAGGSTAGGAGLRLAYSVARHYFVPSGNNRVILASDGDFNVGVSSDAEMERLVEEERKSGVFLTVLGFGMGNLKNSKLELLAGKGNGNYAYIDDIAEARKTLVHEMGGTLHTIAKDVKIQVEFNPAKVQAYRLVGYENRLLRAEDFSNDQKDAGELGAGHSVTALYEIIPVGVRSSVAIQGVDPLRYSTPPAATNAASGSELLFVKLRYKEPAQDSSKLISHVVRDEVARPSADFGFAAAIASFGMILRDSEYKGNSSLEDVIATTQRSLGADAHGYRADFLALVRAYEKIR